MLKKEFPFNWTCPYCGLKSVVTTANYSLELSVLNLDDSAESVTNQYQLHDKLVLFPEWILCPNTDCQKQTLSVTLAKFIEELDDFEEIKKMESIAKFHGKNFS